jgi:lipopolysaccharide transport system ATP-binding protein
VSSIIKVSNLGKKYIIAHNRPRRRNYRRFSEDVAAAITWPARMLRAGHNGHTNGQPKREEYWALRDVDFEVAQGEVVGIIGRNGAGKSTLLKLLSRITEPTTGRIELHGRVASLLEVGTGFHPELTGRENIFLNGAILGMSKVEIRRKFDEVVAFAEVEKFLDTPVKRYSSGMYVRLAFAVAAHLEPEILVIDEVLAVGDAQFQKKCLGKMHDVSQAGRTVLFVSHNMAAVDALCSRGIVLSQGKVVADKPARAAIDLYLQSTRLANGSGSAVWQRRWKPTTLRLTGVQILSRTGATESLPVGAPAIFRIAYSASGLHRGCSFRLKIVNSLDQVVAKLMTDVSVGCNDDLEGDGEIDCIVPSLILMPGQYRIALALKHNDDCFDNVIDAAAFEVVPAAISASGKLPDEGMCILPCEWRHAKRQHDVEACKGVQPS